MSVVLCKHCGQKLNNGQKLARHRQHCAKFLQAHYFRSAPVEAIEKLIAKAKKNAHQQGHNNTTGDKKP